MFIGCRWRRTFVFSLTVASLALAQAPPEPPKVLRITRQTVKPGRAAAQERIGTLAAHAMARTKYPANLLALSSASGESEVWLLESHESFASVEDADAFVEKTPALKWSLGQYDAQNGELVSGVRRLLAVYRKDLSYHGEQLAQDLPKMRYLSVVMVRLHPARDAEFADAIKLVTGSYEKINSDQPLVIYQVVSGAPGPAYLFFSPMASLKTMDEAPARGRAIRESMGEENAAAMLKTSAAVTAASESFLFTLNPRMSYVSKEFTAGDPEFWIPKPPPKPATVPVLTAPLTVPQPAPTTPPAPKP
jgi:hypothetical protein